MNEDNAFISAYVKGAVATTNPGLHEMLETVVGSTGKLVRTKIARCIATALGSDEDIPSSVLARLETLHLASLLHDDIIDGSVERRHCPSVWTRYSTNMAILLGDLLYAIVPLSPENIPFQYQEQKLALINEFARASTLGQQGQILELLNLRNPHISLREYFRIATLKTSSLIYLSCYIGWSYSSRDRQLLPGLREFADNFGKSYQAFNDVTDLTENCGKSALDDIRAGVPSLPIILYFGSIRGQSENVKNLPLYQSANIQCELLACDIKQSKSLHLAAELARKYSLKARDAIEHTLNAACPAEIAELLMCFEQVSPRLQNTPTRDSDLVQPAASLVFDNALVT